MPFNFKCYLGNPERLPTEHLSEFNNKLLFVPAYCTVKISTDEAVFSGFENSFAERGGELQFRRLF